MFAGTLKAFREVEQSLGLVFPDTYKRAVKAYGLGLWQDFWCITSPFSENAPNHPLPWYIPRYGITSGPDHCTRLREVEKDFPGEYPWPIYPAPGGLFPWALTDSGGVLYWLTAGDPDGWPTIYDPHDRPENWERYDLPFAELLFKTLTRECELFRGELREDFEDGCSDAFRPWARWRPESM
ncbi:hypothetical protein J0H58_20555 [bacterium]|nr:hypothetical protein [bacterium]